MGQSRYNFTKAFWKDKIFEWSRQDEIGQNLGETADEVFEAIAAHDPTSPAYDASDGKDYTKTEKQPDGTKKQVPSKRPAKDKTSVWGLQKKNPHKYLHWLCRNIIEHEIKPEDVYKITEDLVSFSQNENRIDKSQRDIETHTPDSLAKIVAPYETGEIKSLSDIKDEERQKIMAETTILYDGPEGKVLIPRTKESAIFWGQGTRWCVSAKVSVNYFKEYSSRGPLVFYLPNSTQVDPNTGKVRQAKFAGHRDYFSMGMMNAQDKLCQDALLPEMQNLLRATTEHMAASSDFEFENAAEGIWFLRKHGGLLSNQIRWDMSEKDAFIFLSKRFPLKKFIKRNEINDDQLTDKERLGILKESILRANLDNIFIIPDKHINTAEYKAWIRKADDLDLFHAIKSNLIPEHRIDADILESIAEKMPTVVTGDTHRKDLTEEIFFTALNSPALKKLDETLAVYEAIPVEMRTEAIIERMIEFTNPECAQFMLQTTPKSLLTPHHIKLLTEKGVDIAGILTEDDFETLDEYYSCLLQGKIGRALRSTDYSLSVALQDFETVIKNIPEDHRRNLAQNAFNAISGRDVAPYQSKGHRKNARQYIKKILENVPA